MLGAVMKANLNRLQQTLEALSKLQSASLPESKLRLNQANWARAGNSTLEAVRGQKQKLAHRGEERKNTGVAKRARRAPRGPE